MRPWLSAPQWDISVVTMMSIADKNRLTVRGGVNGQRLLVKIERPA
jgi:hypothetical protein